MGSKTGALAWSRWWRLGRCTHMGSYRFPYILTRIPVSNIVWCLKKKHLHNWVVSWPGCLFILTPFLTERTSVVQTMVIQTWVSDVHFLQNEPSEPVTGNVDNNDQFQWPESDFKQKKSKFLKTWAWQLPNT